MRLFTTDMIGAAFNKKFVWPGFHWFTLTNHIGALQRNGFEVEKVVNLSQHYAKTTAAWYQRMIANEPLALSLLDRPTYRAWQLYLAGGSGSFLNKRSQVYRIYCEAV